MNEMNGAEETVPEIETKLTTLAIILWPLNVIYATVYSQ